MARAHRPPLAVVTGASAGIGRAAVRAFAAAGYDLGLIARGRDGLRAAADEVARAGGRASVHALDVGDAEAVEAAAAAIESELGPIDVWVNDAMVTVVAPVKALEPEEVRRVTETTYLGAVHGTMAALKRMLPRDRGTIVQVGSALAYRSIPLQAPYCGAKAAIRGFTDSLRSELMHDRTGVRVTMVHMPAVNTPQFDWCRTHMHRRPQPVPPIYAPEVAAAAIVWAARHAPRELNVGGSTLRAVWANKLVPGLLDRYLAYRGYESQQTDEPVQADRRDNLFGPLPGDYGAEGRFVSRSRRSSGELWLRTHAPAIALGVAALGLGVLAAGLGAVRSLPKRA